MQLLVTGGAGFIGSNFVHYLVGSTDHEVVTLDALTYAGSMTNLDGVMDHPRHEFVEGNVRDRELVSDLVREVDVVVNFAAESHVDRSIEGAKAFVRTNIEGTQVLLDASVEADIRCFVQVSTDEVYGQIFDGEFKEDDPLSPRNPYAATKAGADLLAMSYFETHDLPVLITRTSNNYGPRQHPEKLIPKAIQCAINDESIPVYGDGRHVREWTYVDDNCRGIALVIREGNPGEVYNIGSGTELKNIEVVRQIVDAVGASESQIEFVEDRPGHDERYALDTNKVEAMGWEPNVEFKEGLARTIDHYLDGTKG